MCYQWSERKTEGEVVNQKNGEREGGSDGRIIKVDTREALKMD